MIVKENLETAIEKARKKNALDYNCFNIAITGGPGVGKTSLLKGILQLRD